MGGNPGSSLRCLQCRQRKKKCDLEQPSCLRCIRSGSRCSGLGEKDIFIHRDAGNRYEPNKAVLTAAFKARTSRTQHVFSRSNFTKAASGDIIHDANSLCPPVTDPLNIAAMDDVMRRFSTRTLYDSIRAEFSPAREIGIFSGDRILDAHQTYSMIAISIRMLIPMTSIGIKMLDLGVFALLTKYLGAFRRDSKLVELADSSYTRTLGIFHRRLGGVSSLTQHRRPDQNLHHLVLHLCLAMLWFESIDWSPTASKVDIHVKGALSVLQNTEPHQYYRPRMRCGLSALRSMVISMSLRNRCTTFLADPKWRSIQHHSTENTWAEKLNDIAIQIPALLHRLDTIKCLPAKQQSLGDLKKLRNDYIRLAASFDSWLQDLTESKQEALYWTSGEPYQISQPIAHLDPVCKPSFPDQTYRLRFKDGTKAGLLARCWAFQLQVLLGLLEVYEQEQEGQTCDSVRTENGEDETEFTKWHAEARRLSRMVVEAVNYLSCCLEGCIVAQSPWEIVMRYNEYMRHRSDGPVTTSGENR